MPQYLASQLTANMSGKKQDKWRNTLDQRPWQSVQLHPPWLWLTPRPAQKSHIVFLGAGQQPKFSDTEPIPSRPTNRQESFNWDFSQADERRWKDFYIYICKISRKLLLAPRPQAPKHTRSQFSLTFALGEKQSKIIYACSLPWELAHDTLTNNYSCKKRET